MNAMERAYYQASKDGSARSVRKWNVEHTTPEGTTADVTYATREEAEDYAQSCYEWGHTNISVVEV